MTTKNLPPVLDRELGTLKQRVTDLERMLDRIRRQLSGPASPDPLSFAAYYGIGFSAAGLQLTDDGWRHYKPTNEITSTVTDETRRITLDADTFGEWTIRIDVDGIYEIGVNVTFNDPDNATGDRSIAIGRTTFEGITTTATIDLVAAASDNRTTLSGSAIIAAPAGSYWWALYGDDTSGGLPGTVAAYWARAVSYATPVGTVGST